MIPPSTITRPASPALALAVTALCLLAPGCREDPRSDAYDLAGDAWLAEWIGPGDTRLIAAPASEIDYRRPRILDGAPSDARPVVSALDVQLFVSWSAPAPREAALRLEAGPSARAVAVTLNRTPLGRLELREGRHTYRLGLPETAQQPGANRLRLTFESEPEVDVPGGSPFHGAWVAGEGDPTIESLVSADLPPVEAGGSGPDPRLVQWAPVRLRYALRLPEGARLEVNVGAASGAPAGTRYTVALQAEGEPERTLLSEVVPEAGRTRAHTVTLPGRVGAAAWLSLEAEAGPGGRAGVEWHAPRVSGVVPTPAVPVGLEEAAALRARLDGASVVLVVLDAARARQLSTYGYGRSTTLEIDRIAREGVAFDQAYTPATYTISAMSALWTSLHHDQHHHGVNFRGPLPRAHPTLAEILERSGVRTTGLLANPSAGAAFGLDRGFGEFREVAGVNGRTGPRAERLAAALQPQLDRVGHGRFFSYVHFLEPHFPYDQPEPFVTLFGPDAPLTPEERKRTRWITAVNQRRRPFTPEEGDHLVRLYDGNLAYVDREIGRLRRRLEDRGLLDEVVLVITADHGDELFERGVIGHGVTVHEEVLRIPLIIRFPQGRGPAGLRVSTPVDLIDVAPTILDILGLSGAEGSEAFEGRSLLPVVFGGAGRPALAGRSMHERPSYSYRTGPEKLIHSVRTGRTQLYRIPDDPDERTDLSAAQPIRAEMLRQDLYRWLRGLERRRGDRGGALSAETEEALRALGYLQ